MVFFIFIIHIDENVVLLLAMLTPCAMHHCCIEILLAGFMLLLAKFVPKMTAVRFPTLV